MRINLYSNRGDELMTDAMSAGLEVFRWVIPPWAHHSGDNRGTAQDTTHNSSDSNSGRYGTHLTDFSRASGAEPDGYTRLQVSARYDCLTS